MKNAKRLLLFTLVFALFAVSPISAAADWQYRVVKGDTMWKLSRSFGTTLEELIAANPQIKNPSLIYPNDILNIPSDDASQSGREGQVLKKTNEYRAEAGLAPLTLDAELCAVAKAKADDMAAKGYFSHTSPTYGTPSQMLGAFGIRYGYMGENIAKGYASATDVMYGWMNSQGHRANILGVSFKKLGVGYSENGKIWVQIFTD